MTTTGDSDRKLNGADNPKATTASEEDPCIEDNMDDLKEASFRDRAEQTLRKKTGLSRRGLMVAGGVLLLLLALLIVVIALSAAWPRIPHHRQYPVCQEPACLRAAAQIRESLSNTYSPCIDVWNWACGSWLEKNPLPLDRSIWNMKEQLRFQEAVRIRDLITTLPLPLHTGTFEWKLKHFYESCMEVENVDGDGDGPLLQIITELGGWHILRQWSVHSWDYRRVMEKLHAKYGATPFFKVTVEPNPRSPANNSIRIAPAGLGLPDRSFYYMDPDNKIIIAYKRLLSDIVTLLRATRNQALKFSNDIFYYEKRIAEITPESTFLQDPVNTYNPISISELKITAASLPLREILVSMFPNAGITDETEVIVSSPDYLTSISSIVSSTDRSALNNYVIWTLVREYLPYLSSEHTAENQHYKSELRGVHKPLERWEYCVDTVQKYMGLAVQIMLENKAALTEDAVTSVQNIFKNLKSTALSTVKEYNFPRDIRSHLVQKVSGLAVQVGFPKHITGTEFVKEYFAKLYVQKSNLFQNIYKGNEFLMKEQQDRYLNPKYEDRMLPFATGGRMTASYSAAANIIIVPRFLMSEPYYNARYPRSVAYGRLGVDIARAIIESILPYQSSWTRHTGLLSPYHIAVNQSHLMANRTMQCLSKMMTQYHAVAGDVADLTSLSVLKHLSAVKLAHTALQTAVSDDEHVHQPALELFEDSALFYLSYSQSQCAAYTSQEVHLRNFVDFNVDDKTLLSVAWKQLPDFPGAFDCQFDQKEQCSAIL